MMFVGSWQVLRRRFATADALQKQSPYILKIGCILQRPPLAMRRLSPLESAYEEYKLMLEGETSRGIFSFQPAGSSSESNAADGNNGATTGGGEDLKIDVDYNDDAPVTDIRRKLDRKLYMLIRSNPSSWTIPTGEIAFELVDNDTTQEQKSLLEQAKEVLGMVIDPARAELYWPGGAPVAQHLEPLEGRIRPPLGTRFFYYKPQLVSGKVAPVAGMAAGQLGWFTMEEVLERLGPAMATSVKPILSH